MTDNRTTELESLSKLKMAGKLRYWRGTIEIPESELYAICDEIQAEHEQAIAATLESKTCIVTYDFVTHDFKCSNCGKQIGVVRNCEMYETCDGQQAWKSLDHEVCDIPNFCPNCGAKVVKR